MIQKTTENVIDWEEWLKNADKVIEEQNKKNIKWKKWLENIKWKKWLKNIEKKWLENINKVVEPTFTQKEQTEPTEVIEEQTETKPIPAPRTKKPVLEKPIPAPRKKIDQKEDEETEVIVDEEEPTFTQKERALKGSTRSYEISLVNERDPLVQLQNTRSLIKNNLLKVLNEMKGLKFTETLKITFEKYKGDELIEKEAYFNAKTQTITNEIEIAELLQITQQQIVNKIQQWISEGSGWTIQSVDGHFINIVKYEPLKGSSYIPLPEELQHPGNGIINMKNNDNECFRWCHIRHLLPQKKDPQRIKMCDKKYVEKLDYSGIEFPVSVKQYNKIEKQNNIRVNVFGYEEEQKYPIYISKEKFDSCLNLLLITEEEVKHYCLIKGFQ